MKVRMWAEALLALVAAVVGVTTLIWPTWIEGLFEASPDGGDGSLERLVAISLLAASLLLGFAARRDRRRLRAVGEPLPA